MAEKVEAAEMWFYRRILRTSYKKHITNEEVLNRMATKRNLIITIRRRQMSFFGRVMRNKEIENFSISGKGKALQRKTKNYLYKDPQCLDENRRNRNDK